MKGQKTHGEKGAAMPSIKREGFTINYEETGRVDGRPLVLVAGLGEQIGSVEYPDEQCALFAAQGFRIIRLDNRDTGLSTPTVPIPDIDIFAALSALQQGHEVSAPYTLFTMADDVVAVLDAVGIEQAHVMGASMGGYIVRWMTLRHPHRVASLQIVMSGSGAVPGEDGPQLTPAVIEKLAGLSKRRDRTHALPYNTELWRWFWGNGYPFEEEWVRQRVTFAYDRAYRPEGIARQMLAVLKTPSLWEAQAGIHCSTLVIHGEQDRCFPDEHGKSIAARIPGAQLWLDPQMGHILHREQWQEMAKRAAAMAL
jgi:pimeloyl-ACP methyl ester carboxylesterase